MDCRSEWNGRCDLPHGLHVVIHIVQVDGTHECDDVYIIRTTQKSGRIDFFAVKGQCQVGRTVARAHSNLFHLGGILCSEVDWQFRSMADEEQFLRAKANQID
jgi:hypothetical protein